MSIAKIQTGDQVKITSGNHKGIVGQVTKVVKKTFKSGVVKVRASVTNVPKIVKYRKANTFQGQNYPGQQLEKDRTIDISNLSLITDKNEISKSKVVIQADGKKTRELKKNGQKVLNTKIVKNTKALEQKEEK